MCRLGLMVLIGMFRRASVLSVLCLAASVHAQVSVNPSGMAGYRYPIGLPAGVGGLTPSLALTYSSAGGNGHFGMGWSLDGLSVISRCAPNKAIDGKRGQITLGPDDKLCLDGRRLIPTDVNGAPKSYGVGDAAGLAGANAFREYRTEGDNFARVRAYGIADASVNSSQAGANTSSGPAYFKIWTKSGQVHEYGRVPGLSLSSHVMAQGTSTINTWLIARIGNSSSNATNNNYITFEYQQYDQYKNFGTAPDTANLNAYPANWVVLRKIEYGGGRIDFLTSMLSDRSDKREQFLAGRRSVVQQRLEQILVYSAGQPIKQYFLGYEAGVSTNRSILTSIRECYPDASGKCLPSTRFSYTPGVGETYQASDAFKNSIGATAFLGSNKGVLTADFNGDGKTDLLRWSAVAAENQLWFSNGDGTFKRELDVTQGGKFNLHNQVIENSACYKSVVADFNGDGLPDIYRHSCDAAEGHHLYIGAGDGGFSKTAVVLKAGTTVQPTLKRVAHVESCPADKGANCERKFRTWTEGHNYYFSDINADGKLDIIKAYLPKRTLALNSGVDPAENCTDCVAVFIGDGQGGFAKNSYVGTQKMFVDPGPRLGELGLAVDISGDQVADFPMMWNGDATSASIGTYKSWVADPATGSLIESGSGAYASTNGPESGCIPLDYNGDGRADCLNPNAYPPLRAGVGGGSYLDAGNFNRKTEVLAASRIIPADMNGDGLDDLLLLSDDPTVTPNKVFLSTGDGKFSDASTKFNLGSTLLEKEGTSSLFFGDFTGRGSFEILRLMKSPVSGADNTINQLFTKSDHVPADLLQKVTTGFGSESRLIYEPLTNTTRYQSDRGTPNAASAENLDTSYPMYVVVSQDNDAGLGYAPLRTEFAYAGLKGNIGGRGLLGFRETRRQSLGADGTTKLTSVTIAKQNHPYIGMPEKTVTFVGQLADPIPSVASSLNTTTYLYCDKTSTTPDAEQVAKSTGVSCSTTALVTRPYLLRSVSEGRDLDGSVMPKVTTDSTVNNTGDPLVSSVKTEATAAGVSQVFEKTVTNTYAADQTTCDSTDETKCKWIIGRLSSTSVQSKVPNSIESIASSAGTSANASANVGTVPAGQNQVTNTQMMQRLMPIINMLLND